MTRTALVFALMALPLAACAHKQPANFTRAATSDAAGWASIELADDLTYEEAWNKTVDTIGRRFEINFLEKEGGYLRSAWSYNWLETDGRKHDWYRVRTIAKFSSDRTKLDVKSEAEFLVDGDWVLGTDTRLLRTLKTDLMGALSTTTR